MFMHSFLAMKEQLNYNAFSDHLVRVTGKHNY
jgi:hypothetical protein